MTMYRTLGTTVALLALVACPVCAQQPQAAQGTPDCVYVPTPYDVVEKMLDMAKVKKADVVYDLGCGDGRIVVQAAKKCGCKGVGFEIVPKLVEEARGNAKKNKVDHLVQIKQEDLFMADFHEATVLPMYLLPEMVKKLMPKFENLKPGTRIVAHDYPPEGVQPDKVVAVISNETNVKHTLYLFTLPFKNEKWK
jgi:protein-L-isoaspartate O-methyltransferase